MPLRLAQPSGACAVTARLTALHARLLNTIQSTGASYARATQWAAVGAPKMYAPSPTVQITVWSGFASFAPSAAPTPQPRPPDDGDPKYVPGVRKQHWLASRSYSLTTIVRSSITSPTQRETHAMSIGVSLLSARARDSVAARRSRPAAAAFARRSATTRASMPGVNASASAASVSRGAPGSATSAPNPRIGYRVNSGSTPIWMSLASARGALSDGNQGTSDSTMTMASASAR